MKSMTIRLAILAGVVIIVHLGFVVLRAGTQPAEVLPPTQGIKSLPLVFGEWHGTEGQMDPKLEAGTESRDAVDREYKDRDGNTASVFVAFYDNPERGAYHNPMICYRANGWNIIDEHHETLEKTKRPDIDVSVSTWRQKEKRVLVLYWYEMGDEVLFDRWDWAGWGGVRWRLRGQTTWPPMFKVLIQVSADDALAHARAVKLACYVRDWLGSVTPAATAPEAAP